jgi:beta-glucanase (GH16 family)
MSIINWQVMGQEKTEPPNTAVTGAPPKLTISSVPAAAPGEAMASEPIQGKIEGLAANQYSQCKVVIYAQGGGTWWVQPTADSPLTAIHSDGAWESETHGGDDFVALLVKAGFQPAATLAAIPKAGGDILAATDWKSQDSIAANVLGTPPAPGNWRLVWSDEFDGVAIDSNHWKFETGNHNGWGNNELESYTNRAENAFVSNGVLHIVAQPKAAGERFYTSARMKSQGLFFKKYGRVEFRAKLPQGQGYWPALWMMPEDSTYGGWPNSGEIDIVENKGSNPGVVQGTIHYAGASGGHRQSTGRYTFPGDDGVTNFHTYLLEWTTNSFRWYVDNKLYETQTNWSARSAAYPAPFEQPFYIVMNLAIGGNFGGNPDARTVFPGEMQVDYVRVYENGATNSSAGPGRAVGP